MKKLLKLLLIPLMSYAAISCSSDDHDPEYLNVTNANIAGIWKLTSWNGEEIGKNPYMYIVFNRRDNTFEMYENINSGLSHYCTGTFFITAKDNKRPYISGYYDQEKDVWENDYYVDRLTQNQMTWTVKGNNNDVSVYTRIKEIPQDIIDGFLR